MMSEISEFDGENFVTNIALWLITSGAAPDKLFPFSGTDPIILFILIEFQKTPSKFTFINVYLYKK